MAWRSSSLSCVACCSSCVDTCTRSPQSPWACHVTLSAALCCIPSWHTPREVIVSPHSIPGVQGSTQPSSFGCGRVFFSLCKRFLPTAYPIAENPARKLRQDEVFLPSPPQGKHCLSDHASLFPVCQGQKHISSTDEASQKCVKTARSTEVVARCVSLCFMLAHQAHERLYSTS